MLKQISSIVCTLLLLTGCQQESKSKPRYLRIAAEEDPQSLDPRLARNLSAATITRLFYEGLIWCDAAGQLQPALAESFTLSPDKKRYTFQLRTSSWSDGSPVTAEDFAATWKTLLAPDFPAPNSYQLFAIKNARAAKEGRVPVDQIAVYAESPLTLVVELEEPTPHFLNLLATHFFFPVHASLRQHAYRTAAPAKSGMIGNGPFQLKSWQHHSRLLAVKNPHFWGADRVSLEGIELCILEPNTALQLYEANQLDWVGSPLSTLPQDMIPPLKEQRLLQTTPATGTYWVRLNTRKSPFDQAELRHAFALATDRKSLAAHVTQGGEQPAHSIVPPTLYKTFLKKEIALPSTMAEDLLRDVPPIYLRYAINERNHKLAQTLQQQWKKALGIEVILQPAEGRLFYSRLGRGEYQMALGSWFADFADPINFLEMFKLAANTTNATGWENAAYSALLDQSSEESSPEVREQLLYEAEKMLTEEMPVIPLLTGSYNCITRSGIGGVIFSELGYLDFREAYMEL